MTDRIRFSSDIGRMIAELDEWTERSIRESKEEFHRTTREYGEHIRDVGVPVGPSHRKDIAEGNLRASTHYDYQDHGDHVEATVTVGPTDYTFYAEAAHGHSFWDQADEYEQHIEDAINGEL